MLNIFNIIRDWRLPKYGPLGLRQHFGAKGDGSTPDDKSIQEWWDAGVRLGREIKIEEGHYRFLKAVVFDLTSCREEGLKITGSGQGRTVLQLSKVSNEIPFQVICSHKEDDKPDKEVSAFYTDFSSFSVATHFDGPGAQLGNDDFLDALNSCYFQKLKFDNSCDNRAAEALRINHVLRSLFEIHANCHAKPCKRNVGTSVHLRQSRMNVFTGGMSNADIGLLMSGGPSASNTLTSIDFEEGNIAVVIDTPEACNNRIITPQIAYRHGLDFRSGNNNAVVTPNDGLRVERYDKNGNEVGRKHGWFVLNDKGLVLSDMLNQPKRPSAELLRRYNNRRASLKLAA